MNQGGSTARIRRLHGLHVNTVQCVLHHDFDSMTFNVPEFFQQPNSAASRLPSVTAAAAVTTSSTPS